MRSWRVLESTQAASSVCSLPPCGPLWGRGGEGGGAIGAQSRHVAGPPPPTPPHKGEGSPPSLRRDPASNSLEDVGGGRAHSGGWRRKYSASRGSCFQSALPRHSRWRLAMSLP